MNWLAVIIGCVYFSWIDIKERRIPNRTVIIMLVIRIVLLAYELVTDANNWNRIIEGMCYGAAAGAAVMLVARLFSKEGVGMGDVKLFGVIGAYIGLGQIFSVMLYAFLYSAIIGIVLIFIKKLKLKDSLPMAPFALAGLVTVLFINLIWRY